MLSTISFIQTNLQHSIAASGILTRTVSVEGVDLALAQEPWYREDYQGLDGPWIYPLLCRREGKN
jgi:hypothetical protein